MEYTGVLAAACAAHDKLHTLKCIHNNISKCFTSILEACEGNKISYIYDAEWRVTVDADKADAQKAFVRDMIVKGVKHFFPDIETQVTETTDPDNDKNWTLRIKFVW